MESYSLLKAHHMSEKRQSDKKSDSDLESFTIRIPSSLKRSIERIKESFSGFSTVSDAARFVMETGAGAVEPLGDARELGDLQKEPKETLQRISIKWRHGQQIFSRAELAFVSQWAHRAYMTAKSSNVQRSPIMANLQAFDVIRSLRNEMCKHTEAAEWRDRYYQGNLGNLNGESIGDKTVSAIEALKEHAYSSYAEFASRCLEAALRDEPPLPVDRLNVLLRPHLPALIKLALRAYLQANEMPVLQLETGFNVASAKYAKTVTRGCISIAPNIMGDSMTAAIILKDGDLIVAVNGFVELGELITSVGAISNEHQVTGQRFFIIPPTPPLSQYVMRVGGVQIAFRGTEFDDLRAALGEVMEQPDMKSEYERLSWIYGDI